MANSWQRIVMVTIGAFFMIFFMKNLFLKDYNGETNSFFKEIGREDMIPKTSTDLRNERIQKQNQFQEMMLNVTALQSEVATIRNELAQLRGSGASDEHKKNKVIE